ncbi:MAG TPA: hypothetical protein VMF57_02820 [Solirubrobacteraceae bacterium]|nr:hypothetical protein [Solirubrobacteraceae bacterium]
MTLARMWRRQLFAASSAALIVPSTMIAALVALALGGGFSQLGVLGQVFAGPPAPSVGPLAQTGAAARAGGAAALPRIPVAVAQSVVNRPAPGGNSGRVGGRAAPVATAPRTGVGSTGGTIAPGGGVTRPITQAPTPPSPRPTPVSVSPNPAPSPSPGPSPGPAPSPHPTPVDTVVKTVTSVTSQVPGPLGSTATGAVNAAGSAADNLLPELP